MEKCEELKNEERRVRRNNSLIMPIVKGVEMWKISPMLHSYEL